MMIRLDIVKLAWMAAWAGAVAVGELPWWALVALVGFYWSWPYTWLSPKLKRQAKEYEDKAKSLSAVHRATIDDLWSRSPMNGRDI